MTAQISKLSNGMRVITDTIDTVDSVAVGIWADVGTRNELLDHNGVAHMVEHMLFNGTKTRNAQEIVKVIENVGGQMNAYTSRENTAYYIHLLKDDIELAINVLSDMVQNSVFPDKEVEKERQVIIQEIGMTNDTPDDIVFDYYQETAYPNQSLGAPILGRSDIIKTMQKDVMADYVNRFYTAENLVLSVSGNVQHNDAVAYAEKYFANLKTGGQSTIKEADYQGGYRYEDKNLEQSHLVMGFKGIKKTHKNYYPTIMLATLLGGGMSSRLFQNVREKHGLAYSVYASHSAFKDDGQFEVYAGTGPDKLSKLCPVVIDELKNIVNIPVQENELDRAKSQLKASMVMGQESMMSRANRQAKYLITHDKAVDIQHLIAQIEKVTARDIQKIAQEIFVKKPTVAVLGPLSNMPSYDDICDKLAA